MKYLALLFSSVTLLTNCTSDSNQKSYYAPTEKESTGIIYFDRKKKLDCSAESISISEHCEPYYVVPSKTIISLALKNEESIYYDGSNKKYHFFHMWIKPVENAEDIFSYAIPLEDCKIQNAEKILQSNIANVKGRGVMVNTGGQCMVFL